MPTDPTFVSTLTEIANLSLEDLGEAPKDFLTDPVLENNTGIIADIIKRQIYVVIREAQSDFTWDVLYKTVTLTSPEDITENETYAWGFRYPLPDDFLRPTWDETFEYEIMENYIYCNVQDDLNFKYHRYSLTVAEWPSTLLQVIRSMLSIAICMPITENEEKLQLLINRHETLVLPKAERVDAYAKKRPNSRWKRQPYARTRGRRRYGPDDRRAY